MGNVIGLKKHKNLQEIPKNSLNSFLGSYKGPITMRQIGVRHYVYKNSNTSEVIAEETPWKAYVLQIGGSCKVLTII